MSNGKILPSSTFIIHTHTQDHKKSLPEFSILLSCHRKIAEKYCYLTHVFQQELKRKDIKLKSTSDEYEERYAQLESNFALSSILKHTDV